MRELLRASGYLTVFFPPALLVAGIAIGHEWLACAAVFAVSPFLRALFGDVDEQGSDSWSEQASTVLDLLPVVYALVFPVCLAVTLWLIHGGALQGAGAWVGAGASLWTCFIFATVIGHELVHQRRSGRARLGRAIAGVVGYPVLGHEHMPHHATSGNVADAEWPARDESVWRFAARRVLRVARSAIEYDAVLSQRLGGRWRGGLAEAVAFTAGTWAAFAVAGGLAGALLYGILVVGVWFAMQAITYLQHWGLGDDSVSEAREGQYGWEDGCRLQAWMTLSISFHQAHHHAPSRPYYMATPATGSPRLPAGYVFLLVAALMPPLWRRLMGPALARWKDDPAAQLKPGRRLICIYDSESAAEAHTSDFS
jgi:alkane 1-monooxygenase